MRAVIRENDLPQSTQNVFGRSGCEGADLRDSRLFADVWISRYDGRKLSPHSETVCASSITM